MRVDTTVWEDVVSMLETCYHSTQLLVEYIAVDNIGVAVHAR